MRRVAALMRLVGATLAILLLAAGNLSAPGPATAQTSASYHLEWQVAGRDGQPTSSAHYTINRTLGQPVSRDLHTPPDLKAATPKQPERVPGELWRTACRSPSSRRARGSALSADRRSFGSQPPVLA
jgi:hypothetical protein